MVALQVPWFDDRWRLQLWCAKMCKQNKTCLGQLLLLCRSAWGHINMQGSTRPAHSPGRSVMRWWSAMFLMLTMYSTITQKVGRSVQQCSIESWQSAPVSVEWSLMVFDVPRLYVACIKFWCGCGCQSEEWLPQLLMHKHTCPQTNWRSPCGP